MGANLCHATNVGGLKTFLSMQDVELDFLAFRQRAIAFGEDGRVMHKHVLSVLPIGI